MYLHLLKKNKCGPKPNKDVDRQVKNRLIKKVAKLDNNITVLYAVGDNETIKKELPFLETELNN